MPWTKGGTQIYSTEMDIYSTPKDSSLPTRVLHGVVVLVPLGLCLVFPLSGEAVLLGLLGALDALLPPERRRPLNLLLHQPVHRALLLLRQTAAASLLLPVVRLSRSLVILRFLVIGT